MHRRRLSKKRVVNEALRAALAPQASPTMSYEPPVHHTALAPGLDLAGFNRLADELEDQAIIEIATRSAR
ncbi:type II toxin-antitoxin system antitoxin VapB33 [Tsukamurella soli]|uniref:Type II toxin-antitoxin system antitoxin VapB33 n=2 Tax=Tsukamurella soli TaxID=644556 RepID=A0ABP8JWL1_9ACTN